MNTLLNFMWIIGSTLGYVIGIGLTAFCVVRYMFRAPAVMPDEYQRERLKRQPLKPGEFEPDKAWPLYPVRQARTDLRRTGAEFWQRYRRLWQWPRDAFFRGRHGGRFVWWLFFPIPVTVLFFLITAGFAVAGSFALFAAVDVVCVAVSLILLLAIAGLLRGVGRRWHRVMRTDASCPKCYRVTPWPAYQCPQCSQLHRDIRPDRLGVLWRRCQCGTRLPTMPMRAAWRLSAVCQRCQTALPRGSGAVRDIRIPILGDKSVGKTRFLYTALDSLRQTASRAAITFEFSDQQAQDEAERTMAGIQSGQDTTKTSPDNPLPLTVRLGTGRRQTLAHMFDAAGETLRDPQRHDELGFLALGQGLVYVLDPFSVGAVRDRLTGQNAQSIRLAEMAGGDPENAYNETVTRLRDSGVKADTQRLAVVISKVDLLREAELDMPEDSDAIAGWLSEAGVHNLVLGARRDFREVRYFAVASQAACGSAQRDDPGVPLRWLLRVHGVRLPSESARVQGGPEPGGDPEADRRSEADGHPREADRHPHENGPLDEAAESTS